MDRVTHRRRLLAAMLSGIVLGLLLADSAAGDELFTGQTEWEAALAATPDLAHGQKLFATCAACHQSSGAGIGDGTVPAIAGQFYPYVLKRLIDYRHGAGADQRMHHFVASADFDDPSSLADVAAYVTGLAPPERFTTGDGSDLERGAGIYEDICVLCHGDAGDGGGDIGIPRISAQHYPYVVRQMRWMASGTRHNVSEYLVWLMSGFSGDDLETVADYISRLEPGPTPKPAAEP